jgi:exopolysaccharide production protein ExoQ
MSIASDFTARPRLRRIRGGEIPRANPVPWREQRRQAYARAAAASGAGRAGEQARWRSLLDTDAVFAFGVTLPMLFILQLSTLGAAVIAGLTPLYLFLRRADAVEALARRWFLLLFPAFAVFSTVWSRAHTDTLRYSIELVITVTAALLMSSARDPRAVIRAIALAFIIYVFDAVLQGRQVGVGEGAGGYAFSGLSDSKNLMGDIAATAALLTVAAGVISFRDRHWPWVAIFAVGLLPEAYAILGARSAGAMLGLGIALSVFAALVMLSKLPRPVRATLTVILALVVIVVGLNYRTLSQAMIEMATRVFDKDPTLTGRTYLWYRAHDVISQAPVIGQGYSSFWIQGNIDAEGLWRYAGIDNRSGFNFHNTLVEMRVTLGWCGTALFFGTIVTAAVLLVRRFVQQPTLPLVVWTSVMLYETSRMAFESVGFQQFYFTTLLLFTALGASVRPSREAPERSPRAARPAFAVVSYVSTEASVAPLRLRQRPAR